MSRHTALDVIDHGALFSAEQGDSLQRLRALKSKTCDMAITSPPYEDLRYYGDVKFKLKEQAWVDWFVPIVCEMVRVCRGPVCVNVAGAVRRGRYSMIDQLMAVDLFRKHGICQGPQPYAWVKPGMPGSGAKKFHRRNYELVYVFIDPTMPGRGVPWADNLAFSHLPLWGPGGEMSNRTKAGRRVNEFGFTEGGAQSRRPNGERQKRKRIIPEKRVAGIKRSPGEQDYTPPKMANHGNVIVTPSGGNNLGHELAHENEAPMNVRLAERMICWFCPPGGIVLDPFLGSGTSIHAALLHGRRAVGFDLRDDQVDLTHRRIADVLSSLKH